MDGKRQIHRIRTNKKVRKMNNKANVNTYLESGRLETHTEIPDGTIYKATDKEWFFL